LDSAGGINDSYVRPVVEKLLKGIDTSLSLKNNLVQRYDVEQRNGYDCGISVIAFAERVIEQGTTAIFSNLNQNFTPEREKWRNLVLAELAKGKEVNNKEKGAEETNTQTNQEDSTEQNKQIYLQSSRRRRKEKREVEEKLNKTETALLESYEELADTTENLINSQISLKYEKIRNENLELEIAKLKENENHLNKELTKESERASELSDQVNDLKEEIQQTQNKVQKLISLSEEREELKEITGTANGSIQKELRNKI